jgi:fucose permease
MWVVLTDTVSGAIFPILYGFLRDVVGINSATISTAVTAIIILALEFTMARELPATNG